MRCCKQVPTLVQVQLSALYVRYLSNFAWSKFVLSVSVWDILHGGASSCTTCTPEAGACGPGKEFASSCTSTSDVQCVDCVLGSTFGSDYGMCQPCFDCSANGTAYLINCLKTSTVCAESVPVGAIN